MTDREFLIKMLTKICPAGENDLGEFWRIKKDDGSITVLGESCQEITFQFDENEELKWFM